MASRPPRSLLDGVDLAALRLIGFEGGPAALVLACLLRSGAVQFDPADPDWPDRDRVLVDPSLPLRAVAAVLADAGFPADDGRMGQGPGRVLAEGVRAARASQAAGDVYRVFAVLDGASLGHGAVWEALLAAGSGGLSALTLLVLTSPPPASDLDVEGVLQAAGWWVDTVPADPAGVLGGLDRALLAATSHRPRPAAVVVRSA